MRPSSQSAQPKNQAEKNQSPSRLTEKPAKKGLRPEKQALEAAKQIEDAEARDIEIFELELKAEKLRDYLNKVPNVLSFEKAIFEFIETASTKASARMRLGDYRNCVYLGNIVQKIIEMTLSKFLAQKYHDDVYKDKKIMEIQTLLSFVSTVSTKPLVLSDYLKVCHTEVLNGRSFDPESSFIEKLMVVLTLVLNNKAVMYCIRGQPIQALQMLLRTIELRIRKCRTLVSCIQIAVMYINVSYLLAFVNKEEDALTFTNYSALLLEEIDPMLHKEESFDFHSKFSLDYMHLLQKCLPDEKDPFPQLDSLTPTTVTHFILSGLKA